MVTRPVLLAVLAVLPRQFLRLFVDPIEYRQAVSEPPQNEPESLGARPPAFIGFLHGQIIGGLERRRKWGWDLNFSIPPVCGAGTPPRCGVNRLQPHMDYLPAGNMSSLSASLELIMYLASPEALDC